jgi:hypothetical protein
MQGLPPKGEAWFSLSYGHTLVKDHYFYDGERVKQGEIRSHRGLADLGYSITDRLGLRVNLPYVTPSTTATSRTDTVDDGSPRHGHRPAPRGPVQRSPALALTRLSRGPAHPRVQAFGLHRGTCVKDCRRFTGGASTVPPQFHVQGAINCRKDRPSTTAAT